jgi:glutamine cyclotransferase
VIDPGDGDVTAIIDAAALDEWSADDSAAVLNGIAYDDDRGVFYLTGKLWPVLYEVVLVAE